MNKLLIDMKNLENELSNQNQKDLMKNFSECTGLIAAWKHSEDSKIILHEINRVFLAEFVLHIFLKYPEVVNLVGAMANAQKRKPWWKRFGFG